MSLILRGSLGREEFCIFLLAKSLLGEPFVELDSSLCLLCFIAGKSTWEMNFFEALTLNVDINNCGRVCIPVEALVSSSIISDHFRNCECLTEEAVSALGHLHSFLRTTVIVGPEPVQVPLSSEK